MSLDMSTREPFFAQESNDLHQCMASSTVAIAEGYSSQELLQNICSKFYLVY